MVHGVDTPLTSIDQALLGVLAAGGGDCATAHRHIARAQQQSRMTERRDRQVVEIASLVVACASARAAGLALEHLAEFPDDAELLDQLLGPPHRP
jgi:hypothetical protein